jgi:hypothetical protein
MHSSALSDVQIKRLQQSGGLYSQARNFLSHVDAGVDVRTGQFTLAITIPVGSANNLMGPELSATLTFSSMSSLIDAGFGLGWSLVFSELDLRLNQQPTLRLSTGELYSVDLDKSDFNVGGRLAFLDQKLDSFFVTRRSTDCFEIVMKSGLVERLYTQADPGIYVTKEIFTQEGRQAFLDWVTLPSSQTSVLTAIRDSTRTLLSVSRETGLVFHLNPGSERTSTLTFVVLNNQLRQVVLPDENNSHWEFTYENLGGLLYPSIVTNPLGCKDTVEYDVEQNGHLLPDGAPLAWMARVRSWLHIPSPGAPPLISQYNWRDTHNFLGYGASLSSGWVDGRENLYQVVGGYNYAVTETVSDLEGPLKTVFYEWNRFHLKVEETTTRGQNEIKVVTRYADDENALWEDQPPWCQLPHRVTTRYSGPSGVSREEYTETSYDASGNILVSRSTADIVETREYFPADGSGTDCPKDPYGFVRWLKTYKITPARLEDKRFRGASELSIDYTYIELPSLLEDGKYHVVMVSEITSDATTGDEVSRTSQSHIQDKGPFYGMPREATTTLNDFPTKTEWTYTLTDNQLHTKTTVTGFENDALNRTTECDARSIYDGLTAMEQSPAGVKTLYRYDAMGRAVETTLRAGSKYQAIKSCSFHLAHSGNPPFPMFEETDVNGVRRRTFINGDGLVVRIDIDDVDNKLSVFRTVSEFKYDTQNRVIEETQYDWFPDSTDPITLITKTQYDNWGSVNAVISPSGVTAHTLTDPVSLTTETWQTSSGSENKSSGVDVTTVNLSGSPTLIKTYDASRTLHRSQTFIRDGLDRVIEESLDVPDEESVVTRFTYDVFNRVINKVLPDETEVSWEYAKHSDDNHPLSILLTPKVKTTERT